MGPLYWHGLTLVTAWVSNYIHYEFPNFNGCIVDVWERINNFNRILLGMWLVIHDGIKVNPR